MFMTISRSFAASFPMALKSSCFLDEGARDAKIFDPDFEKQLAKYAARETLKPTKNKPPDSQISDNK